LAKPKLEMLAKDTGSGGGGCPSIYIRDDGKCVVQAPGVDGDTFGELVNVLPGEVAGYIEPDVILRAAEMIKRRGL
jgi:hypothetical protein